MCVCCKKRPINQAKFAKKPVHARLVDRAGKGKRANVRHVHTMPVVHRDHRSMLEKVIPQGAKL